MTGLGTSSCNLPTHPQASITMRSVLERPAPSPALHALPMAVLVAGVCSRTGQSVARELCNQGGAVTGLCNAEIGGAIYDDNGPLSSEGVSFVSHGLMLPADALVIAT